MPNITGHMLYLDTCKAEACMVLFQHIHERGIALPGVVVASCELCSVSSRLEPPVDTCQLCTHMAGGLKHKGCFAVAALNNKISTLCVQHNLATRYLWSTLHE